MDLDNQQDPQGYALPPKHKAVIQPLALPSNVDTEEATMSEQVDNAAVNVIRQKIASLYAQEPSAREEIKEVKAAPEHLSKHQKYIWQLSNSGKSLAEIQQAWHNYYASLPDNEKHEVWHEFYASQQEYSQYLKTQHHPAKPHEAAPQPPRVIDEPPKPTPRAKTTAPTTVDQIKKQLLGKVSNRTHARAKAKHHVQSLIFGVSMGALVVLVLLFSFFNERFIAPFVTPSRNVSNQTIIIDPNETAAGPTPEVIIPKINVEIPVVYGETTIDEKTIQSDLQNGVIHYATTASPGEQGNAVFFGHSSNNILNPGKYKFAFVLLSRMETGDTFMLTKNSKRYVYKVTSKKIVKPEDVSVLQTTSTPSATLITCDPPGTSINRLVVTGVQISPDPSANVASTAIKTNQSPKTLPSNSPTLWSRFWNWLSS